MAPAKITYVIGSLECGGAERQLLELLRHIDRRRFTPSLVLFDCARAERANGLVEDIFDLKISAHSNSKWRLKTWKFSTTVCKLAGYFNRTEPDIVQAILPASIILTAAAAMCSRIPHMIGCRRSLAGAYRKAKFLSTVDTRASRKCDVMVGNSLEIVQELQLLDGISPERVLQIPNGVDTDKFRPGGGVRRRYGWTADHVVFGVVANFLPYKRHIDFVDAAERIFNVNKRARFLMAGGDRGELTAVRTRIAQKHLDGIFQIVPGTTEPEELYHAMDVYICPSETEGLSNVLLEAASSGLPIIATRVGGNPEIVRDGYNGCLVGVHDATAIAEAGLAIANECRVRREMGMRGRQHVISHFSIRSMVRAHEELYEKLLIGANPARGEVNRTLSIAAHS
jgi:glycosyltransferase involved in cell wall biosynthesis